MDSWATFDCYGTLIDWESGIGAALARVSPEAADDPQSAVAAFLGTERSISRDGALSYREILVRALQAVAAERGLTLRAGQETTVADSLPSWTPFPEVPSALEQIRHAGWKLAVLSNTDRDYLDASIGQLGVDIDLAVVGSQIGSYKPNHRHWQEFRRIAHDPERHVHVAASLIHDIEPCSELGIPAVWINRSGACSSLSRLAELADLSELPRTLRLM